MLLGPIIDEICGLAGEEQQRKGINPAAGQVGDVVCRFLPCSSHTVSPGDKMSICLPSGTSS